MKKIINGKKYDTKTAECVAEWHNRHFPSDFDYCSEDLYRKKTGEFFLHGEGGARSKYAQRYGQNSWGGGEDITPLTEAEAREWVEEHCDGDDYEKIFGEVPE